MKSVLFVDHGLIKRVMLVDLLVCFYILCSQKSIICCQVLTPRVSFFLFTLLVTLVDTKDRSLWKVYHVVSLPWTRRVSSELLYLSLPNVNPSYSTDLIRPVSCCFLLWIFRKIHTGTQKPTYHYTYTSPTLQWQDPFVVDDLFLTDGPSLVDIISIFDLLKVSSSSRPFVSSRLDVFTSLKKFVVLTRHL